MNKTIAVNIGGCVFNIEEDAYQQLKYYLDAIGKRFDTSEAREEILADVEARMAELFTEMLGNTREVITLKDVKAVIDIMGRPEAFDQDEDDDLHNTSYTAKVEERRMYRDTENNVLGGVAAGLGHYLGWDPVILRIIFIFFAVFGFAGLPIYIILWIVIPEARTTAEKLRMKGSKIDVESISKKFNEGFENVSDTMKSAKVREGADRFLSGIGGIFQFIGQLLRWLVGLASIAIGVALTVGVIAAIAGLLFGTNVPPMLTSGFLRDYFFINGFWFYFSLIGALMCVVIPIFGFLYGGIRLLLNLSAPVRGLGITMTLALIVGTSITITSAVFHTAEFSRTERLEESNKLMLEVEREPLAITLGNDPYWPRGIDPKNHNPLSLVKIDEEQMVFGKTMIRFRPSEHPDFALRMVRRSQGRSVDDALEKAGAVDANYTLTGNELKLMPFYTAPAWHKYRAQKLELTLFVPDSGRFTLPDDAARVLRNDHGLDQTPARLAGGHTFQNLDGVIKCITCQPKKVSKDLQDV